MYTLLHFPAYEGSSKRRVISKCVCSLSADGQGQTVKVVAASRKISDVTRAHFITGTSRCSTRCFTTSLTPRCSITSS